MARDGPWEEHRENVLYRLERLDDSDSGDVRVLERKVKKIEDAFANRMFLTSFLGAIAGLVAVLVPVLALVFTIWRYRSG